MANEIEPLKWEQLTTQEQLVWAAAFARSYELPMSSRTSADRAVAQLRYALTLPIIPPRGIEYEAADAGFDISKDDFDVWYRIEMRNRHYSELSFREPTDEECLAAYKNFQFGRNAFS